MSGMELHEVLARIRPCDTEKPYVFVSYSSEDRELVWRDVLEFQNRGYNVWLDECNLNKTKDSWKEDALAAVEDIECELVVFYVSEHSLCSEPCYNELCRTVAESTMEVHFGPVKFIAVDVQEVGDITEFSQQVYAGIQSSGLDKAARTGRARVLSRFVKEFFNSNNEKVRIHPKCEPGRRLDYYADILAAFPENTRCLPPQEATPTPGRVRFVREEGQPGKGWGIFDSLRDPQRAAAARALREEADRLLAEVEEKGEVRFEPKPQEEPEKEPVPERGVSSVWEYTHHGDTTLRITGYRGEGGDVEIPEAFDGVPVGCIGEAVFSDRADLRGVKLPARCAEVGASAFAGCTGLEVVTLNEELTTIGASAFAGCAALKSLTLPAGLRVLGDGAFADCVGLTRLSVDSRALSSQAGCRSGWDSSPFQGCERLEAARLMPEVIPAGMFAGCGALRIIGLSPELRTVGQWAFAGTALREVALPPSVRSVEMGAFADCADLVQVRFGHARCAIEPDAFVRSRPLLVAPVVGSFAREYAQANGLCFMTSGDAAQQSELQRQLRWEVRTDPQGQKYTAVTGYEGESDRLTIPAALSGLPVRAVGKEAFKDTALRRVTLPEGLQVLEEGCFTGCEQLAEVKLPDSLQHIRARAFAGCGALAAIELPQGLQTIDTLAFARCVSLREVDVPATVYKMGSWAFEKCRRLEKLVIRSHRLMLRQTDHILTGVPHGLFDPLTLYAPAGSDAERFAKAVRVRFRAL